MVALPPRDEARALGLPDFEKILPRHFQRRFDGFRSAAHRVDVAKSAGLVPDQLFGEFLRHVRGEEACMRVGQFLGLACHRLEHARMLMAKAGYRRAAGAVGDLAPVGSGEPDAMTANRDRGRFAQTAMQDTGFSGHDFEFSSGTY